MLSKLLDVNSVCGLIIVYNASVWLFQKTYGVSKEKAIKLTLTVIPAVTVAEYVLIKSFC